VNGIGDPEGESKLWNEGDIGEDWGVFRRTYEDIGVLAARSVVES
jgi:hypothetical protein